MSYKAIFDANGLLAEIENGQTVYVRDDYSPPERSDHPRPMVLRDISPYRNMIDGRMIGSRSEHRELLKRHDCIEVGNETMSATKPVPKSTRREVLHKTLCDMSDKQADKLLKSLKRN